ncbi:MAG TPA: TraB/GumN family protein [Candidatus Manganitrophaceae bacterium]|nr:TraB/GumN family protein [Candidatus Manganitrophaceae bacterium]
MIRRSFPFSRFLFLSVFLLISSCAAAPKQAPAEQKHFLWSVRSEKGVVYLLGSIHVAKPELYPLPKPVEAAFDDSDTLVLEINPSEFDAARLQSLFFQYGLYPSGETLDRKISKETYALAEKKFQESGLPMGSLNQFKPWVVAVMLEAVELQRLGFDKQYGIDEHFLVEAQGKKQITAFETVEYQIGLFDGFSDRLQELFLRYTLSDLNLLSRQMDAVVKGWQAGESGVVEELIFQSVNEEPELKPVYEKLIGERNTQMVSGIEAFLKTKNRYFVVVGAGHLVGRGGIVDLLRKKGYDVEQR